MRNVNVERSVSLLLELVDRIVDGEALGAPAKSATRALFDDHVASHGGSVRLACAFLTAYSVVDQNWDHRSVPTGVRGTYGDKKLATSLTFRHVTFHKNITAFGENLGWKGAVKQFDLSQDARFAPYIGGLATEPPRDLRRLQLLREWSHEQVQKVFP